MEQGRQPLRTSHCPHILLSAPCTAPSTEMSQRIGGVKVVGRGQAPYDGRWLCAVNRKRHQCNMMPACMTL